MREELRREGESRRAGDKLRRRGERDLRRGGGESRRRGDRESLRRGEREYLHGLAGKRDGVAVGVCAHAFEAQDVAHRLTQSPRARTARAGNTSSVGGHHARAFRSDSCASARPSAMSECKISVFFSWAPMGVPINATCAPRHGSRGAQRARPVQHAHLLCEHDIDGAASKFRAVHSLFRLLSILVLDKLDKGERLRNPAKQHQGGGRGGAGRAGQRQSCSLLHRKKAGECGLTPRVSWPHHFHATDPINSKT